MHAYEGWVHDPVYHGHEGWRRLVDEWVGSFDDCQWQPREFLDAGDAVAVVAEHSGRMKGTGALVRADASMIVRDFRTDGTYGEARFFHTGDDAKRAAGLTD